MLTIIIFILILGILVFVHELGHFAMAKWFGIRVDEFGMGFPPRAARLFKKGETEYTLNWIPFGGFVKIHGEDSLDRDDPDYGRSMMAKKWWQQIIVLVAGVTMNVILAWVLFTGLLMAGAPTLASQTDRPELLKNPSLTVLDVVADSPAQKSGIVAGDRIIQVSSSKGILTNPTSDGFVAFIRSTSVGEPVTIKISHEGKEKIISATPETKDGNETLGVAIDTVGIAPGLPIGQAIVQGIKSAYYAVTNTFSAFWNLVTGHMKLDTISGPVGLTKMVGEARKIGFSYVITLAAVISVNLAVINILPLPALDGGRILFVIIETITRRKLPQKFVEYANGIGFILLILLMLVITIKDVIHLF